MASSSTPTSTPPKKYDVFLSFRGEDTRYGFTSYLFDALKLKQILTFIDDEVVRGDEISPSLVRAIEGSKLSVVIFSENYASSKWCLEELVKILECRKYNGQVFFPVFYLVDPSHVRNQTGKFGDSFARLVEEKPLAMDKVQSFRVALKVAADLSGWGLGKFELESEFVEGIVRDLLNKLHEISSSQSMGLVGIDTGVEKNESLLNMELEDVPIVGIWGMGGIGKTTMANVECNKSGTQFEKITRQPDMIDCPEIVSGNTKDLDLSGTLIKEVPLSITISTLESLNLHGCSNVTKFPDGLRDIIELNLSRTAIEKVSSSIQFLTRLRTLNMRGCSKLARFPEIMKPMKSLENLDLSETCIKELPSSIKYLIFLRYLVIDRTPIRELPELPPSLFSLSAYDCASLETVSIVNLINLMHGLNFSNCFKLDQEAVISDMDWIIQSGKIPYEEGIQMILPGSEVPDWFFDQEMGSSVTIQFPSYMFCHQLIQGFAFCLIFQIPLNIPSDELLSIRFVVRVKVKDGEHYEFFADTDRYNFKKSYDSDHTLLRYKPIYDEEFSKYYGKEVTFSFYPKLSSSTSSESLGEIEKLCKVKRCGVYIDFLRERLPTSDEDFSDQEYTIDQFS